MSEYATRPLGAATWDAFFHLAEKHNVVWSGCWCTWFHPACAEKGEIPEGNRHYKERLVREGRAHAALVFDGDVAVAWCEYGSPDELPNYHLKEYNAGLQGTRLPPHLLLRRQELPGQTRRSRGASRCPGPDREGRRRWGKVNRRFPR